ncbi:sperm nuclear basic protein PL-I isoform PLIb [Nonlabens ulvanivorans]|uniref:Sperm nuclear basic protein PL-I isoform PLIb n=1 Tax=Nonlabens ulvanivorans TaxID=906888 RepID=A0A090X391_NONUL|nr:hypothetical protein [Nonlabens ulvanivorans]GAL75622.1 sperm nuclear basic protein PL-I isoform PLIb [Nonlabens ulvanivorans]
MKKLSTLLLVFLMGIGISYATTIEDDRYQGYDNSFIFNEGGIEFAVFPDGQFDFNYLNDGPQFGAVINTPNVSISFNTGYDYDAYVQYDTYGAVIQIENTPIYYDSYGRIIQAGDVFINYRNGYVNRVGNLRVYYNRPGIILRTSGYINRFNRHYVYQPWHGYYGIPLVNNCIVWNNPYRLYYNPYRYGWSYHRTNWNRPNYYNGRFTRANVRRSFHRPNDRVTYRNFERGRRNNNGRAIATTDARRDREAITRGRRTITRSDNRVANNSRNSQARSTRRSDNNVTSSRSNRSSRATTTTTRSPQVARNSRTSRRATTATTTRSNRTSAPAISNRSSRSTPAVSNSRTSRRSTPAVSSSSRTNRSTGTVSGSSRSSRSNTATSRNSSARVNTRATNSSSRKATATRKRSTSTRRSGRS